MTFQDFCPELLAAAATADPGLSLVARRALSTIEHYQLPIGWKQDGAWIFAIPKKLESANKTVWRHWRVMSRERKVWEALLRASLVSAERVASNAALLALGRQPRCQQRMALVVVRLVGSVREFIRDDDNLAFSIKHANDSLKRIGLVKDDNRNWLTTSMPMQDVSPLSVPVTIFILRPAPADGLLEGAPRVHRSSHPPASREVHAPDGSPEERRAVPRVRRRAGARAVDV